MDFGKGSVQGRLLYTDRRSHSQKLDVLIILHRVSIAMNPFSTLHQGSPAMARYLIVISLTVAIGSQRARAVGPLGINWQSPELIASGTTDYQDMAGADRYLAFSYGSAHVTYFNQAEHEIQLLWRDNGYNPAWGGRATVGRTVPTGADSGAFPSLAVSQSGRVVVSYVTYDVFDGVFASMATPSNPSNFHDDWMEERLFSYDARHTAVAFDRNGDLGIAFHDRITRKLIYEKYAIGSEPSFDRLISQTVTNTYEDGWWPSLEFYGTAAKIASYNQERDDVEFHYRLNTGVWHTRVVDSIGFTGARPSIAMNPRTGRAAIAYYDRDARDLRFGQELDSGDFVLTTLDSVGNVGEYVSLAFDPLDARPVLAYTDFTNGDLKLAWHDGASWRTEIVDGVGRVGWTPSIAFADDGRLAIAYMSDETDGGDLLYIQGVPALPGDFNGDGAVAGNDLQSWRVGFGATAATFRQGDGDGDLDVDGSDFLLWQRQLGSRTPRVATPVPEPAAIPSLMMLGSGLIGIRRLARPNTASGVCASG